MGGIVTKAAYLKQYRSLQRAAWTHNRALLGDNADWLAKYDQHSILLQRRWFEGTTFLQGVREEPIGWGFGRIGRHLSEDAATQVAWRTARKRSFIGMGTYFVGACTSIAGIVGLLRPEILEGGDTSHTKLNTQLGLMVGGSVIMGIGQSIHFSSFRHLHRAVRLHNARVPFE